jgi:hypothetical protein
MISSGAAQRTWPSCFGHFQSQSRHEITIFCSVLVLWIGCKIRERWLSSQGRQTSRSGDHGPSASVWPATHRGPDHVRVRIQSGLDRSPRPWSVPNQGPAPGQRIRVLHGATLPKPVTLFPSKAKVLRGVLCS